ncbi:hypothetical protein PR003_g5027 [Phytophthora rubi]|uniref:Secreted protein n=1 Tax=Phytophthora rubi TaxID=129364 RepID=A0A6A4G3Z8_9STRA|nr:hypothetical protein PR002_g5017 [Phytophthora rubi]KAE9046050.1 hypothetical protein PR001_g4723 [Phytophthora rubi]KAE9351149.1 hypothetical protein PR003_g5027 [Phytophthora rubi]
MLHKAQVLFSAPSVLFLIFLTKFAVTDADAFIHTSTTVVLLPVRADPCCTSCQDVRLLIAKLVQSFIHSCERSLRFAFAV